MSDDKLILHSQVPLGILRLAAERESICSGDVIREVIKAETEPRLSTLASAQLRRMYRRGLLDKLPEPSEPQQGQRRYYRITELGLKTLREYNGIVLELF